MWESARKGIVQYYPDADPELVWRANIEASGGFSSVTFSDDGVASWAGPCARKPHRFSWEIVAATPEKMTLDTWSEADPDADRVTLAFESPRKMTVTRGRRSVAAAMTFVRLD